MQASDKCYTFIKKCEGYSATAYDDGGGVQTIGWGTIRWDLKTPVKKGDTIAPEEAQRQLEIEVHRVEDAINSTVKVPLSQPQFDSLISLFYNIGIGWCTGIKHKQATLISLLNAGRYEAVPAQFLLFERDIHGKLVDGLTKRRKWEAQMWLSEDHDHVIDAAPQNDAGQMPQTVKPRPAAPEVASAAARSWTIRGAVLGAVGVAGQAAEKVTGYASGMAADISAQVEQSSPLRDLAGKFLSHTDFILLGLMGAGLLIVVARRLSAAAQGREG